MDRKIVRFADYEFDLATRELRRAGRGLDLEQKPGEMLRALLERPGELVTRLELQRRLWPAGVHLDFEHGLNKAASKLRAALRDSGKKPRFIETLSQRGYRFIAEVQYAEDGSATPSGRVRLAVLPFENATGEPGRDDLAAGLAEEAIARLGSLLRGGIRVIAHSSARRYAGSPFPVAHIARDLAVDCVLTGALARGAAGYELRLELVAAADQARMWAGKTAAATAEQLAIEPAVVQQVGRTLSARVRPLPPRCAPLRPGAAGREAYLRARKLWHERTETAVRAAIGEYQRAARLEPALALAYAGVAEGYMMLNSWGAMAPKPAQELAEEAAQKALRLNPCLAEPHVVAAYSKMILEDDWPGAEQAFRAAISRNPSSAIAHQLYGFWQVPRGVFEPGLASNARALELDPLSAPIHSVRAWLLLCAGRPAEAQRVGDAALAMHAGYIPAHTHAGSVFAATGRTAEGIAHLQTALHSSGGMPVIRMNLAMALALAGQRAAAMAHMEQLEREGRQRYLCGVFMGMAYATLGMPERAAEWVERNFEEREPNAAFANVDPRFAALRADSRFRPVLERLRRWLHVA